MNDTRYWVLRRRLDEAILSLHQQNRWHDASKLFYRWTYWASRRVCDLQCSSR